MMDPDVIRSGGSKDDGPIGMRPLAAGLVCFTSVRQAALAVDGARPGT